MLVDSCKCLRSLFYADISKTVSCVSCVCSVESASGKLKSLILHTRKGFMNKRFLPPAAFFTNHIFFHPTGNWPVFELTSLLKPLQTRTLRRLQRLYLPPGSSQGSGWRSGRGAPGRGTPCMPQHRQGTSSLPGTERGNIFSPSVAKVGACC